MTLAPHENPNIHPNIHPRLPYAKLDIHDHPCSLQCCAIRIQAGRASFIGHEDQTDQYEAMQWLVAILNSDVLPDMPDASASILEGYYPIGKEGMFLHGFCWSTMMSATDYVTYNERILLVPDMRYHYPEKRMRWLHLQEQAFPIYDHTFRDYLKEYSQLQSLSSICTTEVYNTLSKVLYQHFHHSIPLQESPSIKPYFWVSRIETSTTASDGDAPYRSILVTHTTDPVQLDFENTVMNMAMSHIFPHFPEKDFSGYYPLYGSMFPIPKTTLTDVTVIKQGDYGSWIQSCQWPAKIIVSNDTHHYCFSRLFVPHKTHVLYPIPDLPVLFEQGDMLRWNAVLASQYLTREKAIAYIKSFLEKIIAENITLNIVIPSSIPPEHESEPEPEPEPEPELEPELSHI